MIKTDMGKKPRGSSSEEERPKTAHARTEVDEKQDPLIVDSYNEHIGQLSRNIAAAAAVFEFMAGWQQVQSNLIFAYSRGLLGLLG